jgi:hypothetical protein
LPAAADFISTPGTPYPAVYYSSGVSVIAQIVESDFSSNLRYAGSVTLGSGDVSSAATYTGELCGCGVMNQNDLLFFSASTNWIFNTSNGVAATTFAFQWNSNNNCTLNLNAIRLS